MSKKARKLSALEQKLHQSLLLADDMTLSQKQVDTLEADPSKRVAALNFLLSTGLVRILTNSAGGISYRAAGRKEVEVKKDLNGEESLVLSHIQASNNEGIWTKHLKAKTELHQTVIDRCLKSLVQKQLIKPITNVKHPTRKTYMLFHLEPSSSITGGPWYTDNELDTEFIKHLLSACLRFIREKSFPKTKTESRLLYPISSAPAYPTAQQIQNFLSKSRITETTLSVEHVEMLLSVLIMDGEIEKIPAFGAALWESSLHGGEEEDSDEGTSQRGKRKKKDDGQRRKKQRKRSHRSEDSETSEDDRKKSKRRKQEDNKSGDDDDENDSDKNSDEDTGRFGRYGADIAVMEDDYGGAFVFRAVRQEKLSLGWFQSPCGRCPRFEFCKEGGPVNPRECVYYGDWLDQAEVELT